MNTANIDMPDRQGNNRLGLLGLFAGISLLTLAVGGWLTMLGMGAWYDNLQIPACQPDSWVFTPAWTLSSAFSMLGMATTGSFAVAGMTCMIPIAPAGLRLL